MPIVAISGASHSGKTTFITGLQNKFSQVEFYDEIIRNYDFSSIDEIRKDASQYFQIQKEIISQKINQEEKAKQKDRPDKLIIFDRSLADSIYYFTTYVNREALSEEERLEYNKFFMFIYKKAKEHFLSLYDSVFLFEPIDPSNDNDSFRPKNLKEKQGVEYLMIKTLTLGLSSHKNIHSFNVLKNGTTDFFDRVFSPSLYDYDSYSSIEEKSFPFYNVLTNKYGSIEVDDTSKNYLKSAALYSTNKESTDIILNMIKELETTEDYMNSRCYPTGLWDEGNVMIVGEAPGQKGRSYIGNYLKPSFIYTKTSYILRKVLEEWGKTPYITNLLKYAMPDNNVPQSEFEKSFHIFKKEVELMKPSKIIALGNNVEKYLSKFDFGVPVVKVLHPAATLYQGMSIDDYKVKWEI